MKDSFENYWKNIYQNKNTNNYESQSLQSKEIIDWHKKYIQNCISNQFKKYKPRVLDIGCCSGNLTNLFCQFSSEVVGVDYEEGFIKDANSKYSVPKFFIGDIYNLDKIDGSFDLVVCFGVLQNISDLVSALKNIKLKLSTRNHSKVVFTTINQNSIFNRNDLSLKLTRSREAKNLTLRTFTEDQFYQSSKLSGLKLTRYEYLYILPRFLGPLRFFIKKIMPTSFSHHIFVEMQHA
tara:strand:- start:421 stop:1128 length:708 start_codon:yes stop_codon:yes gene_type:complete